MAFARTTSPVVDSIDEVIQSEEGIYVQTGDPHRSLSNVSINRTAPLRPVTPSARPQSQSHSSPRMDLANGRSYSHTRHASSRKDPTMAKPYTVTSMDFQTHEVEDGSSSSKNATLRGSGNGFNTADFFSAEVFNIVIHNPTTAHRFLRYCQSRACGENMEFLQKVDKYMRLTDELSQTLGSIHQTYTSHEASRQINIPHSQTKQLAGDIKQATQILIPSLETIFLDAQEHVQKLLASDIYPRFVKHQVTATATMALADHRERFAGLGDCFCLTDPSRADNPILYASDGFVSVTGYSRKDIIPRNCRFLQGEQTDSFATRRLREAIHNCEETVELLLNYRKNGDPFWNLLYVSPLFNEQGEVSFFLGGQINCSTTIHSCTDVLRVLSVNDDELDRQDEIAAMQNRPASVRSRESVRDTTKTPSSFFKSFRKYRPRENPRRKIGIRDEAGMESELIDRVAKMSFKTQVEAFYTAYSKYIVMTWNPHTYALNIQHYSPGVIDMLSLNLPNGDIANIYNKDIFKTLAEYSTSASSSAHKAFKTTVRDALRGGKAVSVETGLLTGFEEKRGKPSWFSGGEREGARRREERFVTHWTPMKDQEGRVRWVALTIAPKMGK